ncbi:hypothetical protein AVEN_173608-1 [Araneus ventricosus]|uniref:Uncharacterized protein n=1 Tax=Araneus ventricosus TaxID=182803 RepID=A0A4Y2CUB1_ARAVE|nr:hypothetical protein AVEN_173608-1 [Araneus ventricosus]
MKEDQWWAAFRILYYTSTPNTLPPGVRISTKKVRLPYVCLTYTRSLQTNDHLDNVRNVQFGQMIRKSLEESTPSPAMPTLTSSLICRMTLNNDRRLTSSLSSKAEHSRSLYTAQMAW